MTKLKCSIGVIVYNEAENIGKLLVSLLNQKLETVSIDEIIVVSSACTDNTDNIVEEFSNNHEIIKLIKEKERNGKSSAINKFIEASKNEILIIESGDTIPSSTTIEKIVTPFYNKKIGMTGGRPIPENSEEDFVGFSVNLLWRLHHKMALKSPKLGEMIAFRRCFDSIPVESAVDEASIEENIRKENLEKKYIPNAIIHNKGPETLKEFISQRRRIATGHIWLKDNYNYSVSSQNKSLLFDLLKTEIKENPKKIIKIFGTMFVEIYSRFLGWYDYKIKKENPFKWKIANSTKKLKKEV